MMQAQADRFDESTGASVGPDGVLETIFSLHEWVDRQKTGVYNCLPIQSLRS